MTSARSLACALLLTAAATSTTAAQTGDFADGELLMRTPAVPGEIYRIDPVSGTSTLLWNDVYPYTFPGTFAFDPSRDAVLAYAGWGPTGYFFPRLFAVSQDGSVLDLGFDDMNVQVITPVGDGRVYCNTPDGLHLIDATNVMAPVPDGNGVPVDLTLDHLYYHAPTNSLIGLSTLNPESPCSDFQHLSVHRLPLTPNGRALSGPITCTKQFVGASAFAIGIDPLPGGDLLVGLTGVQPGSDDVFFRVDPFTLGVSLWSESTLDDIDGAVWSDDLSRVIVYDDKVNEFRSFFQNQGGDGSPLSIPGPFGDGTTGLSPYARLIDVELGAGACSGSSIAYGDRLAGTGGVEPRLGVDGCPTIGGQITFFVADGVGQTGGVLAIGAATAEFPLFGGNFYVLPPFLVQIPVVTGGTAGVAGSGGAVLPLPTPANGNLVGLSFYAQVGLSDPGAPQGFSFTNAVKFVLGN